MSRSKINRGRARREELRESAESRAKLRLERTNSQQIEHLDKMLGKDIGAKKERERLERLIEVELSKKNVKRKTSGSARDRDKRKNMKKSKSSSGEVDA